MKINKKYFIVLTFFIFWGIIGLSMTTGFWKTKMQGIEVHDEVTQEDIKGWMKFKSIEKLFNVPLEHVSTKLNLPAEINTDRSLKDLKEEYGFEMDNLRETVINYRNKKEPKS